MSPDEIYSLRFCLGHEAPSGVDLREHLAGQLEGPPPEVNPALSTWQEIDYAGGGLSGAEREQALAGIVNGKKPYWQHKLRLSQISDRPFVVRIMWDVVNRWPTFESIPKFVYSFWAHVQHRCLLSPYGDLAVAAILNHNLDRKYLNANENIGPNSEKGRGAPPDENLARELHEIGTTGPDLVEQSSLDMTQAALLLTGLRSSGFDAAYQEPGDRTILGKTFAATPGSAKIIEDYLRWIAVHPKTAEHQTRKLALPLLGRNLTPALHEHMQQVWLDTGGDQRKVLQAMVLHDDAWNPVRAAPLSSTIRRVMHIVINKVPVPLDKDLINPKHYTGYEFERAPNPEGLPIDERLIASSFLLYPINFEGTAAQKAAALSHERSIV